MKKRTDEEKLQMINEACDLFIQAADNIKKGKRLLHLCGIETCVGFDESEIKEYERSTSNVHIYSGIKKLGKLCDLEPYFKNDYITEKPDKSRVYISYKGLVFLQLGQERTSTSAKFTFR